jgi:hypothetical protein
MQLQKKKMSVLTVFAAVAEVPDLLPELRTDVLSREQQ